MHIRRITPTISLDVTQPINQGRAPFPGHLLKRISCRYPVGRRRVSSLCCANAGSISARIPPRSLTPRTRRSLTRS